MTETITRPNRSTANYPVGFILVVESDPGELAQTVDLLSAAGYQVVAASRFEEAKHVLAHAPPSLLIADVKLGAYNGLHLIVRSHVEHPEMGAILTNDLFDPVLKAEAERLGALYLSRPWTDQNLIETVGRLLEASTANPVRSAAPRPPKNNHHCA